MFNSDEYKKGFNAGVEYATKNYKPECHTAHWISEKHGVSHYVYVCDHCNGRSRYIKSRFCPHCGYEMIEKDKGEE